MLITGECRSLERVDYWVELITGLSRSLACLVGLNLYSDMCPENIASIECVVCIIESGL